MKKGVPSTQNGAFSDFDVRVADDLAQFGDLWPRTDNCDGVRCYAFQCADILQVWCDSIGKARGTRPLFVGVFDEAGAPLLLLPLGIEREGGLRVLRFLDGGVCDYNAPIIFRPTQMWDRDAVRRLWRELVRKLPRFDLAMFDKMPTDVCGARNPFAYLDGTPSEPSGHVVNIRSTWQEYAERLPYKRESIIQRRRLSKLGPVAFIVAESPADRQRILEAMLQQKSRRYLETWGTDGLDRPGYRQYYSGLVERSQWPGPLVLSALEVNGEIVATNWGFLANRRFIGIVMTFEAGAWKRLSPGRILLEDLLKWNFERGNSVFDFGLGDETYKLAYADQTLALCQAAIPVNMIGKIYHSGRRTRAWRLVKRVQRSLWPKLQDFGGAPIRPTQ